MKLSTHFTLQEFTDSPTRKKLGIDNTPTPEHIANMKHVCEKILEPVRAFFKKPITINSGYRNPALNKAIGGSSTSQHTVGQAVDFEIRGVSNKEIADWVADNLEFDQVILEFFNPAEGPNSGWVHASLKKDGGNRKQKLIASKDGSKTVYRPVNDFDPTNSYEQHR